MTLTNITTECNQYFVQVLLNSKQTDNDGWRLNSFFFFIQTFSKIEGTSFFLYCWLGESVVDSQLAHIYIPFQVWINYICSLRQSHRSETQFVTAHTHILSACKLLQSQVFLVEQLTMHTNINVWKYWYGATEPKPYLCVWYGHTNKELEGMEKIILWFSTSESWSRVHTVDNLEVFIMSVWINISLINNSSTHFVVFT